jgi:aminomethyltransferase
MTEAVPDLKRTPLYEVHLTHGARMTPFAGYEMPVRYAAGTIAEHHHTRTRASLFDVSHMGVVEIVGSERATALERLVPSDIIGLGEHRLRYAFLTNSRGGILDDLIVRNNGDRLILVVNASRKEEDLAYLQQKLAGDTAASARPDLAILALQGPEAASVLGGLLPVITDLPFMGGTMEHLHGVPVMVSRSGYTGEDGFELILPAADATHLAEELLEHPSVELAGLGARDTLRLEAGLCLYGQDLDETTTPVEAGLVWAMQKRRREEGGFPGFEAIRRQLAEGPARVRVGIRPQGRAPVRSGDELTDASGGPVGTVTSGGFGPTVGGPVAMGYVAVGSADVGTPMVAHVRGKEVPCRVADLPFVPHRYYRRK